MLEVINSVTEIVYDQVWWCRHSGKEAGRLQVQGQATQKTIPKLEVCYTSRTFVNATMSSHSTQQLRKGYNN
jgi:hypothetical protein